MKDCLGREYRKSSSAGNRGLPSKDSVKTGRKLSPEPPPWLGEYGAKWYRWAITTTNEMGTSDAADASVFEAAAECFEEFCQAKNHIKENGMTQEAADHAGNVFFRQNPSVVIAQRARQAMRLFRGDLGLTPAARAKFLPGEPDEADPFEMLLKM